MTRINIYLSDEDGKALDGWFNPGTAVESVAENTEWNEAVGHLVSLVTSAEDHEQLYRTAGGRWVLNHWSNWRAAPDTYKFVSDAEAKDWLLRNGSDEVAERWFGPIAQEAGPGRPEVGGAVHARLGQDLLDRLDAWGASRALTRAEAIRHLLDAAMQADPVTAGA